MYENFSQQTPGQMLGRARLSIWVTTNGTKAAGGGPSCARGAELSQHLLQMCFNPAAPGSSQPTGKGWPSPTCWPWLLQRANCCSWALAIFLPLSSTEGETWHWLQKPFWLQKIIFGIKLVLAIKEHHPPVGDVRWWWIDTEHTLAESCSNKSVTRVEFNRHKVGSA